MKEQLYGFSTQELVEGLRQREGVKTEVVEPYSDKQIVVNGPAIILTVVD